jgi:signal transduction histidine kinase
VYLVVSEALANVAKYAGADQVEVSVGIAGEQLRVRIADDGHGGADPMSRSGLRGLADRVAALGVVWMSAAPQGQELRWLGSRSANRPDR